MKDLDLTFLPHEAGVCENCGETHDVLFTANMTGDGVSISRVLCRECAQVLSERMDSRYAEQQANKVSAPPKKEKLVLVNALVVLVIAALIVVIGCVASSSGGSHKNFAIEGQWKNVGTESCAQMQVGSITSFDGEHCNVYSPYDTYAFYESDGVYHLDCTSFFAGDSMNFIVDIIDDDNIILNNTGTRVTLTRVS